MRNTLLGTRFKLVVLALMSSLLLIPVASQAHEVQPAVGDITVTDGRVEFQLRFNLEAFLADVDLDAVTDIDDADVSDTYDALRALPGEEIADRAPTLLEGWNALPMIRINGNPVTPRSTSIEVDRDIPLGLPRTTQWTLVADDLPGTPRTLTFAWPEGAGPMVLRQQGVEEPYTGFLNGGNVTEEIALGGGGAQAGWQAFVSYIPVGFDHILPKGLDHILFVLGLFFLSTRLGPLLWQVSAFTLAHTVSLALGALGLVTISGSIVEPLIALSIVYVAVENIFFAGLTRWRPFVVFLFGLLHGLGFASVLAEFGLPQAQFIPALIGFNVGVELGQLTVIAAAALLIMLSVMAARQAPLMGLEEEVREHEVMFRAVSITGSLLIAIIGAWWVVERVFL
ncbi:MAG: HupE/UreJ family protein [Sulfitobacter sp.]|nr:HupE/UreJ family protein [Sulfitobacter sp.]